MIVGVSTRWGSCVSKKAWHKADVERAWGVSNYRIIAIGGERLNSGQSPGASAPDDGFGT